MQVHNHIHSHLLHLQHQFMKTVSCIFLQQLHQAAHLNQKLKVCWHFIFSRSMHPYKFCNAWLSIREGKILSTDTIIKLLWDRILIWNAQREPQWPRQCHFQATTEGTKHLSHKIVLHTKYGLFQNEDSATWHMKTSIFYPFFFKSVSTAIL